MKWMNLNFKTIAMKKATHLLKLVVIFILALTATTLHAQPRERMEEGRERIEAMKIAFLTRKMQLTPAEAREFWPIYNAYHEKMKPLIREREKSLEKMIEDLSGLSDEEINEMINKRLNYVEQTVALRKQFIEDLKEVLPPAKIIIFMEAEQQFNRELQQRLNQRRNHRTEPGR